MASDAAVTSTTSQSRITISEWAHHLLCLVGMNRAWKGYVTGPISMVC